MEFSKKLAIGILSFCGLIALMVFFSESIFQINMRYFLDFLTPIIMTILVSYFGKSAVENAMKITNDITKKSDSTDTNK